MSSLFDIKDRVALITGSAGGLGLQVATAFAREGASIALCDIAEDRLQEAKQSILELGVECEAYACDLTDVDAIKGMVKEVAARFGRIDILVNNAGVSCISHAQSYTDEEWRRVMDVNLDAYFFCSQQVIPHMIEQGSGHIINMASMHSEVVMPNSCWPVTAYSTTKGAVRQLTKALAVEFAPYGIIVNAIAPGYFRGTGLTQGVDISRRFNAALPHMCPMHRMGEPGELDGVALLLASDASSYITGQTIFVDGGWTCT